MKAVRHHRTFTKHYKQRIAPNQKLKKQFQQRVTAFIGGMRGYPLDDHPLTGKFEGRRAFSVTGDLRVLYVETSTDILFLDVGSHNQVY